MCNKFGVTKKLANITNDNKWATEKKNYLSHIYDLENLLLAKRQDCLQ